MKENGAVYYYITNLQGDVVRLVNAAGNTAAWYKYDPYGNATTASGSHATINPLRYRGYYYDTETGLYYCQSRYYDPTIGRFINADAFASTGQGIIGHNMFAYCLNNPVLYSDPLGARVKILPILFEDEDRGLIFDQNAENIKDIPFGWGTVGKNGCGAVGIYDTQILLGQYDDSLEDIIGYLESNGYLSLGGKFGTKRKGCVNYFLEKGYSVTVVPNRAKYNDLVEAADVCILWLVFKTKNGSYGAHYTAFTQENGVGYYYNAYLEQMAVAQYNGTVYQFMVSYAENGGMFGEVICISKP